MTQQSYGVVTAYKMVQQTGYCPGLNLLYAMEGALTDKDWRNISAKRKAILLSEVEE